VTGPGVADQAAGWFAESVIALVEAPKSRDVRASIGDAFADRGWEPPWFLEALPSAGAGPAAVRRLAPFLPCAGRPW
jgi:hypothetical protein